MATAAAQTRPPSVRRARRICIWMVAFPHFGAPCPEPGESRNQPIVGFTPLEFQKSPTNWNEPCSRSGHLGWIYCELAGPGQRNLSRVINVNQTSENDHGRASRQSAGWQAG